MLVIGRLLGEVTAVTPLATQLGAVVLAAKMSRCGSNSLSWRRVSRIFERYFAGPASGGASRSSKTTDARISRTSGCSFWNSPFSRVMTTV